MKTEWCLGKMLSLQKDKHCLNMGSATQLTWARCQPSSRSPVNLENTDLERGCVK
jgi:hypothetical protein